MSKKKRMPGVDPATLPAMEKLIPVSVMTTYCTRCINAIRNSVQKVTQENIMKPDAVNYAAVYLEGAEMMFNLFVHGLLDNPEEKEVSE